MRQALQQQAGDLKSEASRRISNHEHNNIYLGVIRTHRGDQHRTDELEPIECSHYSGSRASWLIAVQLEVRSAAPSRTTADKLIDDRQVLIFSQKNPKGLLKPRDSCIARRIPPAEASSGRNFFWRQFNWHPIVSSRKCF